MFGRRKSRERSSWTVNIEHIINTSKLETDDPDIFFLSRGGRHVFQSQSAEEASGEGRSGGGDSQERTRRPHDDSPERAYRLRHHLRGQSVARQHGQYPNLTSLGRLFCFF